MKNTARTKKSTSKKTKTRTKKKQSFLERHPLLLPVTGFFVVVFFGLGMFVTVGATTEGAQDKRIVELFVDRQRQTISTRAKTVDDLLNRLDVDLLDEDIVEPSREAPIIEDNMQVNIYRARPVAIVDGDRTITVLSAQRAPRLVAQEANIPLDPSDLAEFQRSEGDVIAETAGERLVITRSIPVQLNIYGTVSQKRTLATTVGEVLAENGISVSDNATLQPADINAPVESGMLIAVNRVGIETATETEPVPFAVETREDASLERGQLRVEREGVNGERTVIYEVMLQDGQEVDRKELQAIINKEPVSEIRIVGTALATLDPSISLSADKTSLMAAAGIAPSDYPYVDYIVTRESNWRPGAVNASSGAYGLCQSLPASKMASAGPDYLTNPITQLRWCSSYAAGRYGGWQGAYNAWLVQGWW